MSLFSDCLIGEPLYKANYRLTTQDSEKALANIDCLKYNRSLFIVLLAWNELDIMRLSYSMKQLIVVVLGVVSVGAVVP